MTSDQNSKNPPKPKEPTDPLSAHNQLRKTKNKAQESSGPFQVIGQTIKDTTTPNAPSELSHPPVGPPRLYDCSNYETCLNLAAALNWDSFTCLGCCGEINPNLLWRAQQQVRKDQMAKAICELPDPRERIIESPNSPPNLRLVFRK